MNPKVTFVVPCYKLGHLLPGCVNSILSQTFGDFELLIMDDCSPDNTPEVAQSFRDARVKHIRNERNLGHLRNYNKGIELASGEYIWLISADDWLRKPYVLERYVHLMEDHPAVGYVFCPAIKFVDGRELGVMPYSEISRQDAIIDGHKFLTEYLALENIVPAPAAMARKQCYQRVSLFPLDLPHAGDWYLWGMFALYSDVGFFAEPMINRRYHDANMSSAFCKEATLAMFADNLAVPQRLYETAKKEGFHDVVDSCKDGVIEAYLRQVTPPKTGDVIQTHLRPEEFEQSLRGLSYEKEEEARIRARVYEGLADVYYERGDSAQAAVFYRRALEQHSRPLKVRAKLTLLQSGHVGQYVRRGMSKLKQQARRIQSS